MSVISVLQRDRRVQIGALAVLLLVWYFLFPSSADPSGFSVEEINDLLSGSAAESDITKVENPLLTLETPFVDESKGYDNNWRLLGDSVVKDEFVRITSESKDQSGLLVNRNAFDDLGFQVDLSFNIHGKSTGLKGDGLALFLTETPLREGPVFGAEDKFNGLAVFFDTYRNARKGKVFPFINVMNGDGYTSYDKQNDGKANQLAGCTARHIYNSVNGVVDARLIHTTEDGYLSLDYKLDENTWINCFSIRDIHIPKKRYLGFGAATGDLVENVDIFEARVSQLQHHGKIVQSFEEFAQDEASEDVDLAQEKTTSRHEMRRSWRKERTNAQRAKLRAKLRNKKNRKSGNIDHQGADEGPSFLHVLWWLVKMSFFTVCGLVVVYVAFTIYRVRRRDWVIKKKHTGLLD